MFLKPRWQVLTKIWSSAPPGTEMADNNDPDRERLAQASRYICQAVEEILQQSGVPPSTTSTAATARMPPPATPVQPAQSTLQRSTSNGDNRPFKLAAILDHQRVDGEVLRKN